jgi:hypothetical protein
MATTADNQVEMPSAAQEWTPEQQIAHMLALCEAQIEAALSESDLAVDSLVKSFGALADLTAAGRGGAEAQTMSKRMADAVIAFQFYDKLTQRLGHVRYSLTTLAQFVCDRSQSGEREQWRQLFMALRRQYRTQEERQIFQLMVEGVPADEARSQAQQTTQSLRRESAGDIELF